MKSRWQLEREALDRLGFAGVDGSADRARAVETVSSLLQEIESLKKRAAAQSAGDR